MDLRDLEAVIALAEELHFGRAAQRLHMAQSPLSQRIRRLEAELGVRLFERSNRRVELTTAGGVVLEQARSTLDSAQAVRRAAEQGRAGDRGQLALGYVASAAFSVLPRLARSLPATVSLRLERLDTAAQLLALRRRQIDAGITRAIADRGPFEILASRSDPMHIALPADHPLSAPQMADLTDEPFIATAPRAGSSVSTITHIICAQAGFVPRITHRVPDLPSVLGLVSGGLGVALLPDSITALNPDGVRLCPLPPDAPALELNLVCAADRDDEPIIQRLRRTAQHHF